MAEQVSLIIDQHPEMIEDKFQITFMGSGEPLNNFKNADKAARYFFNNYMALEKINISTILPYIDYKLFDIDYYRNHLHLQYSLHFSSDEKRNKYFNADLPSISGSIRFINDTSNELCDVAAINYMLIEGENDSVEDAYRVIDLLNTNRHVYLKISEMSNIKNSNLVKSRNTQPFIEIIRDSGLRFEMFQSMGTDVNAGCGQFYNESIQ